MNPESVIEPSAPLAPRRVHEAKTMACHESAKVMAAAVGTGLLLNVLPTASWSRA